MMMKNTPLILLLFIFSINNSFSQEVMLKALDANWEKAQLDADADFISSLLAEDFIWIHNHATLTDNKEAVVNRAKRQKASGTENARSRNSKEVEVIILSSTAVVTGTTIVDRGSSPTNYNFMRTYLEIKGKWFLLGNHTMAVPDEEE